MIARNPFAKRTDIEPGKLIVLFLGGEPDSEARKKILTVKANPEELHMDGREIYIYFPNGMGRSKLSTVALERTLKTPGTARNWNSVTKLLAMAEAAEAPNS